MGVHINSVISLSILSFDSDLYVAITDKEEYCFNSLLGEAFYSPFFVSLDNAITTWMNTGTYPSGDTRESEIQDLVESIYSSYLFNNIYGATLTAPDSRTIFTMDGFRARIKTDPISYYEDGVEGVFPAPDTAPNIESDIALIGGSLVSENANLSSTIGAIRSSFTSITRQNLFEDVPPTGNPPLSKTDLGEAIFNTLHYKEVYQNLDVGSLTLPSYI